MGRRLRVIGGLVAAGLVAGATVGTGSVGTALAEAPSVSPAAVAAAKALQAKALTDPTSYSVVESLTTEVGPRLAGTPGDKAAVDWAVRTMKALGLENVRTEPFQMTGWTRGVETAEIVGPLPQRLVTTALGYSPATPPGGVTAEVVRFETFADLQAAAPGSLTGKIAYIAGKMIRAQDGAGYGPAVIARSRGPHEAAKKGAVALVIRSIGTDNARLAHTGMISVEGLGLPAIPAAAISNPDADQLDRLTAKGPVKLRLELGSAVTGEVTSHNVIGEVKGREAPDEVVLIGAHLDSWDVGTGALDDGAGVGIVLGAAKLIKDRKERPRRTVRVVLFGAEEVGLIGAKAYVLTNRDKLDKIVVATEADFGAGPIYRFSTFFAPDAKEITEVFNRALAPLGIVPGRNDASGGPDIGPMRALGVPVVSLHMDGTEYFDIHHTPSDTLDKVDPRKIAQSTAAYATFTLLAAEATSDFRPTPLPPPAPGQ